MPNLPHLFVQQYIQKTMQERVTHEWRKKPKSLHYRICHQADELFFSEHKGQIARFENAETVLILGFGIYGQMRFEDAKKHLGLGGGTLIISADGQKFIAETEASKAVPTVTYSSG